ncbi:hypothetical protein KC320_g186 [Hortaea werneckii]|nr:hypothetical protein KC320_g186 [Hortaea werneckii]
MLRYRSLRSFILYRSLPLSGLKLKPRIAAAAPRSCSALRKYLSLMRGLETLPSDKSPDSALWAGAAATARSKYSDAACRYPLASTWAAVRFSSSLLAIAGAVLASEEVLLLDRLIRAKEGAALDSQLCPMPRIAATST